VLLIYSENHFLYSIEIYVLFWKATYDNRIFLHDLFEKLQNLRENNISA
jgi:hypothetical protein